MTGPLQITIEYGPEKIVGFVMKLNTTGMMVEVDRIPYRVGAIVKAVLQFPRHNEPIIEEMRAIKSYDRFFRNPPKKGAPKAKPPVVDPQSGQPTAEPQPKKLTEVHFVKLKEETRAQISRYLMDQQVEILRK